MTWPPPPNGPAGPFSGPPNGSWDPFGAHSAPAPQQPAWTYPAPPYGTPPPPRKRRTVLWILGCVAVLLVVALAGVGGWIMFANKDEDQIKDVAARFAAAVDAQDQSAMLAELCSEEADELTSDEDYVADDGGPVDESSKVPFNVETVTVKGDVAALSFTRPTFDTSGTLYLRKESNTWKVCKPAAQQFNG
ncbi:zinc finger protein 318 [Mycolicibacterium brisbanense]|uniref:Zinc finger protein 318 n=1 Tax=Mycolicibacterium brisbanense TaxID=146020 RepID=A0A100W3K6_9MYCO|nr:zinc finger protein 318 [Mycolicibacterium brisbanense]